MKRIVVMVLLALGLFLVSGPVATDAVLAADAAAQGDPASPEVEQELEEYVPSQKVSADASISFPVDI